MLVFHLILVCCIIIMVIVIIRSQVKEQIWQPLSNAPTKCAVYDYLIDKVYIQNKEILKFIDFSLYYATLNPPVYYRFLDELNQFYKDCWLFDQIIQDCSFESINQLTELIIADKERVIDTFHSLQYTTPFDLIDLHESQLIVLRTILREQTNVIRRRINVYNFNHHSLKRW